MFIWWLGLHHGYNKPANFVQFANEQSILYQAALDWCWCQTVKQATVILRKRPQFLSTTHLTYPILYIISLYYIMHANPVDCTALYFISWIIDETRNCFFFLNLCHIWDKLCESCNLIFKILSSCSMPGILNNKWTKKFHHSYCYTIFMMYDFVLNCED